MDLLNLIPKDVPKGWEKDDYFVGGLIYLGFSAIQTEKLIVISSQGQRAVDCKMGKKHCEENYDKKDLIACAEVLGDELVPIAGEEGGGLRKYSSAGDILDLVAPFWPMEQVIFMPWYNSWYQSPEKCTIIFEGYNVLAYEFSKCGNIWQ